MTEDPEAPEDALRAYFARPRREEHAHERFDGPADPARLRALLAECSAAPWILRGDDPARSSHYWVQAPRALPGHAFDIEVMGEDDTLYPTRHADARLIAAARNWLPEILNRLWAAEAAVGIRTAAPAPDPNSHGIVLAVYRQESTGRFLGLPGTTGRPPLPRDGVGMPLILSVRLGESEADLDHAATMVTRTTGIALREARAGVAAVAEAAARGMARGGPVDAYGEAMAETVLRFNTTINRGRLDAAEARAAELEAAMQDARYDAEERDAKRD